MKNSTFYIAAVAMSIQAFSAQAATTGRQLDVIGAATGTTTLASATNPNEVFLVRPVIGLFLDDRCSQVSYTFNSSLAANTGTAIEIAPTALANTIQTSLNRWNDNPSSFVEMNVDNVTPLGDRLRIGGDFVNEIVFRTPDGFTPFASSISTSLLADTTFIAGEDLDGDGDADVYDPQVVGLNVCSDIDSDGDIEFPAGDYKAGTILDNDVQFRADLSYALEASDSAEIDVDALATHEFGHSHGLSHSMINQISPNDANGSSMYAFLDNTDEVTELAGRSLHVDDLAASAFLYPEGKGTTPNTNLQSGDIAFKDAYAVLTGRVSSEDGEPILSAAISAVDTSGARLTQTYAGANSALAFEDSAGGIFVFVESVTASSGDYELPVPLFSRLTADIEAIDGLPLSTGDISTTAIIAGLSSDTSFPEETGGGTESATEDFGDSATPFLAFPNNPLPALDFVIADEELFTNTSNIAFTFNSAIIGASNLLYAEMFDRDTVLDILANEEVFTGGTFRTITLFGNRSSISSFNRAQLALGTVDAGTGNVTITNVLDEDNQFVAQEDELSAYNVGNPANVSATMAVELVNNPDLQVFLIAEANNIVPVRDNIPNALISQSGLDDTAGTSFLSVDNGSLAPIPFGGTFNIQLRSIFSPGSSASNVVISSGF